MIRTLLLLLPVLTWKQTSRVAAGTYGERIDQSGFQAWHKLICGIDLEICRLCTCFTAQLQESHWQDPYGDSMHSTYNACVPSSDTRANDDYGGFWGRVSTRLACGLNQGVSRSIGSTATSRLCSSVCVDCCVYSSSTFRLRLQLCRLQWVSGLEAGQSCLAGTASIPASAHLAWCEHRSVSGLSTSPIGGQLQTAAGTGTSSLLSMPVSLAACNHLLNDGQALKIPASSLHMHEVCQEPQGTPCQSVTAE